MDHLRRQLAPLSDSAWSAVDEEAGRTLRHFLGARALVELSGPNGWDRSSHDLGRVGPLASPADGVDAGLRAVQPLVELCTAFEVPLAEMDSVDRGNTSPDLSSVVEAARRAALAEDRAVFHGLAAAGIEGIIGASPHAALEIGDDYGRYPQTVARAVATLRGSAVGGPYGMALGSRFYTGVVETTEHGGYPLLEHLRLILGGPLVWAPAVDGAVVVSLRGGDYRLVCGQDFAVGYAGHGESSVQLYLQESFTFAVEEEGAGVYLAYPD